MSKTNSLHYQLCVEAARWLHRQKFSTERCPKKPCWRTENCHLCGKQYKYVAVELCTWNSEHTDVWGLASFNDTVVVEVKTSRADFRNDRKKWCRSEEAESLGLQAGAERYYLCPEGIIKPEELPDKWGLLYWDGIKIYTVKKSARFENTGAPDMDILTSILRRENFPETIFNYRGARTAIRKK